MAEALLEVVLENLNSLIHKELASFWHVDKEIEKLSSALTTIKAVLEDAEKKQITNQALKVWLQKLKDAAYLLDDILDECSIKSSQLGYEGKKLPPSNQVNTRSSIFLNPKNMLFRYKVGKKMKEIRERLDQIAEERQKFHLREGVVERGTEVDESRQTSSIITEPQVYGRDEDREKIVEYLLRYASDCNDLSVYSIVGIGGIGKTTLAQLVFNDERVSKHFDLMIWVCVSENFSVKRILRSIIESTSMQSCNILELETIQKLIQELLQSKRYLLILDDVWNENQEKWDKLKYALACGSEGASILVTTRLGSVASIMGTIPTHHLSGLSEVDCWSLFKQRAFGPYREECAELLAIGKEIVKKCGGLPLAAKALGGLLRFKSEEKEWLHVKESELWDLPENGVLPALRLSYFNLPLKLRQCLAFCAIFPKEEVIRMELLIHLWMANGFISSRGRLEMEDVGREIWNELYQRSFFQDIKTDEFGQVESFKMHDFVHDLAYSVMGEDCLVLEEAGLTNLSRSTRHITCSYSIQPFHLGGLRNVESLRTLILQKNRFVSVPREYSTFQYLRALSAGSFSSFSLKNFIHLRYLDLSGAYIKILPKSIYGLQKLQTLKLEYCPYLLRLPKYLRRLKDLRHLYIRGCPSLSQMPPKMGELTCLKSLSTFIVGTKEGYRLAEIQHLELAGQLEIRGLENLASALDARDANLIGKKGLQRLELLWYRHVEEESLTTDDQQVLEALQPHSNLKSLTIRCYLGVQFPNWMTNIANLTNVVFLEIGDCRNCMRLPALGKLPFLKSLEIYGMKYVQYIDDESYDGVAQKAFMSLETLIVQKLPNLESFLKEERMDMFPCLFDLSISAVPRLRSPCFPSVKHLYTWKCREELLLSIPNCHNLRYLSLAGSDLISLPEGMMRNLSSLKTLRISCFTKLKLLPIELVNLIALEQLYIERCSEIESFPEQAMEGLCSLRTLWIAHCKKFKSLSEGIQHLSLLEDLKISYCPNLVALPNGMNHLNHLHTLTIECNSIPNYKVPQGIEHIPCLRSLNLHRLHEVTSFPNCLGDLTTLQSLYIIDCPNLTTLPASFQHLTNLHEVEIFRCPELQKQCKEEGWDVVRAWSHFMTRYEIGEKRVQWKRKG